MKFVKQILTYLQTLFSNKTDQDPKLVVGVVCTILWVYIVIYHLHSKTNVQSEIIWANVAIISSCFGLDVMRAIKAMNVKSDVASSVLNNDSSSSSNNTAQSIIQADKPE